MNPSRYTLPAVASAAILSVLLVAGRTPVHAAQDAPPPPPPAAQGAPPHDMPAPKNLKVLPKNLTGKQVHDIMEKWEGELGSGCKTCHAVDPKNIGPNGKPRLNFADDSKEEKQTARLMYKMVEEINAKYVSKVPNSGDPVTCGTCHRGHLGPEPFVPAPDKDEKH